MRLKAKYTKADYKQGATRLKRVFAYFPTYINGVNVWFEFYDVLQVYNEVEYKCTLEGEDVLIKVADWVNVSKRIITNERTN